MKSRRIMAVGSEWLLKSGEWKDQEEWVDIGEWENIGVWNPLRLFDETGEQGAWYDPSDISTLYQDAAGTVPVTAPGDPVGLMLDKSGNDNHATQSTSAARPTYQVDSNDNGYLKFDKVDDFLEVNLPDFGSDAVYHYANEVGTTLLPDRSLSGVETLPMYESTYGVVLTDDPFANEDNQQIQGYLAKKAGLTQHLPEDDIKSGPGPQRMQSYDPYTDTGYYGEVSATELISGDDLASVIGLTAGTSQFSDAGWLKFYVGANAACNRTDPATAYVIFVAKMPFRYNLSWNDIDAAKDVNGTDAPIVIGGEDYTVRLMQGADKDPSTYTFGTSCADNPGENSEWNALMYRIHEDVPNCANPSEGMAASSTSRHGGPQVGDNFDDLADVDTGVLFTLDDGCSCWCQEVVGPDTSRRVCRGRYGIAGYEPSSLAFSDSDRGWRPVLEIVQQSGSP